MQSDQTENVVAENHRHNQQRTRPQTRRQKSHLLIQTRRRSIVETNRLCDIDVFRELFEVERNDGAQTRRHISRRAPFMTDSQLARRSQLNHVAAIDVHHPAQLRNDHVEKTVEIDRGRQGQREAIDNAFARLVHLDLAFERERLCSV